MAIHIITGKPGSGKTYFLAKKGKEFLEQGLQVYSNFWLNYKGKNLTYYKDFAELMSIKNGIILMDEAQIYLNARFWDKLPAGFQYKLQQHRKHGLSIWGASQSINRLDIILRELVNHYYEIRKIGTGEKQGGGMPKRPFGIFFVQEYDIRDANNKKRHSFGFQVFFMKKSILQFFDTLKDLGFVEPSKDGIVDVKMKICPTCGSRKVIKY